MSEFTIERVSVNGNGIEGNSDSSDPTLSADGRFIAFSSQAYNLVSGDTNARDDIFVHDRQSGATERVSVDSNGAQANGYSFAPSLTADGRFVVFASAATNLVAGDTNAAVDIFVHDRQSGVTERVSIASNGAQGNFNSGSLQLDRPASISADGRFVAFASQSTNLVAADANGINSDVFVHDRQTGVTSRVSVDSSGVQGNDESQAPSISADGRFVAFRSEASNLVAGDTNGTWDIFVHDRQTGATERVSVDSNGIQANHYSDGLAISADGRFVAFVSFASNLVVGDTNGCHDVFVHDRQTGATQRVSLDSNGAQGNSPSDDSDGDSLSISADGRFVAFISSATNLAESDTNGTYDLFIHDRQLGKTERASVSESGDQANGYSRVPSISANGQLIGFLSRADNLVPGDTNGVTDIFVASNPLFGGPLPAAPSPPGNLDLSAADDSGWSNADNYTGQVWGLTFTWSAGPNGGAGVDHYEYRVDSGAWTTTALTMADIGAADGAHVFSVRAVDTGSVTSEPATLAFTVDTVAPAAPSLMAPSDGATVGNPVLLDWSEDPGNRFNIWIDNASAIDLTPSEYPPGPLPPGAYAWAVQAVDQAGNTSSKSSIFTFTIDSSSEGDMIERVSVGSNGVEGNSSSHLDSISADGRFVAFSSWATNLVSGDTNGVLDVFVHDRQTGVTERVSISSNGAQGTAILGTHGSEAASISADGRFIAFDSDSANLVAGDTSAVSDIFVHDRQTGTTERVSVSSNGVAGNAGSSLASISADGRFIVFGSSATNLVAGDTNARSDIFVHDRQTATTELIPIAGSNSAPENLLISPDGRFVAFQSWAQNVVAGDTNGSFDFFLYDRDTGATERISVGNNGVEGNSDSGGWQNHYLSISADNRFVAFVSNASNLVAGDTNGSVDIFVRDRQLGITERVSVDSNGAEGNAVSIGPSMSADGRFVAFESAASNLVAGDANGVRDIFVHDRQTGMTELVSFAGGGAGGTVGPLAAVNHFAIISADGRFIAFNSEATNLVPGDTNGAGDVFVVANPLFDETAPAALIDVYRFYNGGTGTHFYTGSEAEKDQIVANPGNDPFLAKMVFEGPAYKAFGQDGAEATELYRFYNTATGAHFFTASEGEKNHIVANPANDPFLAAMALEGVAYYVLGQDSAHAIDVWRFYNNATGVHFYTASESEKDHIVANPGNDPYLEHLVLEGVGFWVPDEAWGM